MAPDRKYYSVSEVADVLSVSDKTIRRRVKADDIPHRRVGRQIRIPAEWVEADSDEEAAQVSA